MRSGMKALIVSVMMATTWLCGVAAAGAQDGGSPPPETGRPTLGRERINAEILGLDPAGEPSVSAVTAKGDSILSAPFTLREEGRLAADIATESYRMAAGAPVVHREFKPSAADQSEAIQAWCGPGEMRGMFGWSGGITVCMVHTADGKANLGSPPYNFGPWWMTTSVGFASPNARTERVAVEPAQTPSVFKLIFVYERLRPEGVAIHGAIEGPGSGDRPYRFDMARQVLPLTSDAATLDYDGLRLRLMPERRGDLVAATSERVRPPVDLAGLRRTAETAARTAASIEPADPIDGDAAAGPGSDAQTLEPTPFVVGGVRLDPATMTVGTGILTRGGVVLSGSAQYAVTGRLKEPLILRAAFVNETSPAGTVLHQVEFSGRSPLGTRTMTRIWCGPIMAPTIWSRERVTMCLRRAPFGGWEAFWPYTGRPWLGTTKMTGNVATLQAQGLSIEASPTDLLDPLAVRAEIQRITNETVTLRLFARRGEEDALIFTVAPTFADGVATVMLWSHRLVLMRSGNGVAATLSADGDGQGPTDDGVYP